MNHRRDYRYILIGIFFIPISIYIAIYYYTNRLPTFSSIEISDRPFVLANHRAYGWISSSLYRQLQSYLISRNDLLHHIPKTIRIQNKTVKNISLNYDYLRVVKNTHSLSNYPYSKWECSNTSNTDFQNSGEYCILTNIYYNSALDKYYFYQDPSQTNKNYRNVFMAPNHPIKFTIVNNSMYFAKKFRISSILTRPILVSSTPGENYARGLLDTYGPRFWVLAECQYHASYINPSKIQMYLTSKEFKNFPSNWKFYKRQSDGVYEPTRTWEQMIQSMSSIYPLLTYKSFNRTNVMFKYMIFTGRKSNRSPLFSYTRFVRKYSSYPMSTQHYRRAYLAYSEWILNNFNLSSKFELTKIQKELQVKQISESIPICNDTCTVQHTVENSTEEYTGEWIVVLNRAGSSVREVANTDELVQSLLEAFPNHSNPYLRVWPTPFSFSDNLYETARFARSIRLLIGVHSSGLANALFMRPGTILYEINLSNCRDSSFNFRRWAEILNLQHALWLPSNGEKRRQNNACDRVSHTTINVKEIIGEVKNMLKNEIEYRDGYMKRALNIMTDLSIVDYPPKGYESILL